MSSSITLRYFILHAAAKQMYNHIPTAQTTSHRFCPVFLIPSFVWPKHRADSESQYEIKISV